jgi:predicted phosphodiesterase
MGTVTVQGARESAQAPLRRRRGDRFFLLRRFVAVAAVVVATLGGAIAALALYQQERDLQAGRVELSIDPFHDGALDVYVPVVDWGARFPAVRFPARLNVDVRAIDRDTVTRVAAGAPVDVDLVRREARDAIASFLKTLLLVVLLAGLAGGAVAALVVRGGASPRPVVLLAVAAGTAVVATAVVALTLPPRGPIDHPQYYAFGPDIPRALDALERVRRSSKQIDEELNAQLVGLARLVQEPGDRPSADRAPRFTVASDLHNNVIAVPILERAAHGGPVLFPGDLTDRGSPLETTLVRRVVRAGRPFVFISGNHDSDTLERQLMLDGAVVLHRDGRLLADGGRGPIVVNVAGVRVAGYDSPVMRLAVDDYADRYTPEPPPSDQSAFAIWLDGLLGKVDVVMVHDAKLAGIALERLADDPPTEPLVLVVGHSHHASLKRIGPVTVIDGGSLGAGGTGNLKEHTPYGLAELAFEREPFTPLAADLVQITRNGSATAQRERLDQPPASPRGG